MGEQSQGSPGRAGKPSQGSPGGQESLRPTTLQVLTVLSVAETLAGCDKWPRANGKTVINSWDRRHPRWEREKPV